MSHQQLKDSSALKTVLPGNSYQRERPHTVDLPILTTKTDNVTPTFEGVEYTYNSPTELEGSAKLTSFS